MKKYISSITRTTQFYVETDARNEKEAEKKILDLCDEMIMINDENHDVAHEDFEIIIMNQDIKALGAEDKNYDYEDEDIDDFYCQCKYCMNKKG